MSGTPEVILNVDDNEAVRYARTRVLQRAGYSVAEAKGGEEAWTKICAMGARRWRRDCNGLLKTPMPMPCRPRIFLRKWRADRRFRKG